MMYGTKFCFNKKWAWFDCVNLSFSCIHAYWLLHLSLHSSLEIRKVIIEIKEKDRALWHLYRTCARTRIMSEIEEEQEYGGHEEANDDDDGGNDGHEKDNGG